MLPEEITTELRKLTNKVTKIKTVPENLNKRLILQILNVELKRTAIIKGG